MTLAAEAANSIHVVLRGKILDLSPNITPTSENITQEIQNIGHYGSSQNRPYKNACLPTPVNRLNTSEQ